MIRTRFRWILGTFLICALSPINAWAALFHGDFYTEITRTFTYGSDVYFDRTSMTGSFVFDNSLPYPFPSGKPVLHLKNERFINDLDSTATMLLVDPGLAPADWFVGSDEFAVDSYGMGLEALRRGNDDAVSSFNNPTFRMFVGTHSSRTLDWVYIQLSDTPGGTSYADWHWDGGLTTSPIISWKITAVPEPQPLILYLVGVGMLALLSRGRDRMMLRKK